MNLEQRVKQLTQELQILATGVRDLEQRYAQAVEHFNANIQRLDGIDRVAYATAAMVDLDKFKITKKLIDTTNKKINGVDDEMERWQEKQAKKAEKEAKKDESSPKA